MQVLIDEKSKPEDLTRPGHMFPLRARSGGVLARAGHTEASMDLCRLAGLYPAAVICEVMCADGTMARMPDLLAFATQHDLRVVTVNDIIVYRLRADRLIERVADASMPTLFGDLRAVAYRTLIDEKEHLALVMGEVATEEPVLVRVHDACVTGTVRVVALRLRGAAARGDAARGGRWAWGDRVHGCKRGTASGCTTGSAPTGCRKRGPTRSTRTRRSGSRRTAASRGSGCRS